MDDINVSTTPVTAASLCTRIVSRADELRSGLTLNPSKSVLFSPSIPIASVLDMMQPQTADHAPPLVDFRSFKHAGPGDGIVVLGTPIGPTHFIEETLRKEIPNLRRATDRLPLLPAIQSRLLLLRYCAPQRLNHIIRTVPPLACQEAVRELDHIILETLKACQEFGCEHQDWVRLIRLPLREGGFGLPSAHELAPLAYAASVADALRYRYLPALASLAPAIERWLAAPSSPESRPPWDGAAEIHWCLSYLHTGIQQHRDAHPNFLADMADDHDVLPKVAAHLLTTKPKLQQRLARILHEASRESIMDSASESLRARLLSLRQRGSSTPLLAIPSCAELTIPNDVLKAYLRSYQAIPELSPSTLLCSCLHNASATDPRPAPAIHTELCHLGNGLTIRHDTVASELVRCCRDAGLEVHSQFHHQGPGEWPDIEVFNFPYRGHTSFIEVSIVSPLQSHFVKAAAARPLHAAEHRERGKLAKYRDLADRTHHGLYPAVMETTSAFGKGLQSLLATINSTVNTADFAASAPQRTWSSATFLAYWSQRLAIAFWMGATRMTQHTAIRRAEVLSAATPSNPARDPRARPPASLPRAGPTTPSPSPIPS